MTPQKHIKAAWNKSKKVPKVRQKATPQSPARAQPEGKKRAAPGAGGAGDWYHIVVRPKGDFVAFRFHDVGKKGGDLERLAGKRQSGSWATQAWLVNKRSAHVVGKKLVADTPDVKALFDKLGFNPERVKADIFARTDETTRKDEIPRPKKATPRSSSSVAKHSPEEGK